MVRMWGWQDLGQQVGSRFREFGDPKNTIVVVTSSRTMASELAFYLPTQPDVYLWNPNASVTSQYDVWGLPEDRQGWDVWIVGEQSEIDPRLFASFEGCSEQGEVTVPIAQNRHHRAESHHFAVGKVGKS